MRHLFFLGLSASNVSIDKLYLITTWVAKYNLSASDLIFIHPYIHLKKRLGGPLRQGQTDFQIRSLFLLYSSFVSPSRNHLYCCAHGWPIGTRGRKPRKHLEGLSAAGNFACNTSDNVTTVAWLDYDQTIPFVRTVAVSCLNIV